METLNYTLTYTVQYKLSDSNNDCCRVKKTVEQATFIEHSKENQRNAPSSHPLLIARNLSNKMQKCK